MTTGKPAQKPAETEAPLLEVKTSSSFGYPVEKLEELIEVRTQQQLASLDGINGLLAGLKTNATTGLSLSENPQLLEERKAVFGTNVLPPVERKSIFMLMWMAIQDQMLVHIDS